MIAYPYGSLAVGVALSIAAVILVCRHWLLKRSGKYPSAPSGFLQAEWAFAMALLYVGLHYLMIFATGAADMVPPQPAPATQFLALALLFREGCLLANIIRQKLPRAEWDQSLIFNGFKGEKH